MKNPPAPKARHTKVSRARLCLWKPTMNIASIFVPNHWRFENIAQPFASHSNASRSKSYSPDGSIELKFLDNLARRSSSNQRPVPRPPSSSKTPEEVDDDEIISDILGSPTASEMEPPMEKPAWLGMLKVNKTFEPNLDILQDQWTHPNNQVKRKWYVSSYTLKQRESFRYLWMKDMRRLGYEIEFFKWFEMTGRIENCVESLQVIINKWYTASKKVVESGTVIKASPFKEKSDKKGAILTTANIDRVVEQNNYSNQILHIISRQIEDTKPNLSGRPTPSSTSSNQNIETYPGFKIPEFSKEKFPKLSDTFEVTGNIIEKINAQLNNFNISIREDKTSKKVSTLHEETNLLQKLASSRFYNMKNYHDKPSFRTHTDEENAFLSTSSHEGRSITEWNIDGLAEHQVYNKLHEIGVAITAYKIRGKVMIRPDCNLNFWKERFISGLPTLFADKVSKNPRPTINIVALELCTDIKLKHHLKKEKSSSRKELGSFCRDFGFITSPDKIQKDKKEKSHRKKSRRRDDSTKPRKNKSRSKRPNDSKIDVCWTCGKTGHKANECCSKTKKKKINLLNI
ncbi:hypothetical protein H5410_058798 [Solanum commersonii]|uniref:CCHC-type domain-containing protein n=1 Tax=Solanum commersonii TaxID=4109 RepID=A0A9J5WUK0_SOLCO|nr:hypothetical protein H5410_058798 [Solanum commersonii]